MDDDDTEKLDERLPVQVSRRFLARLDAWRARQPDVPNRSKALRRMAEERFDADEPRTGRRKPRA